MLLNWGGGGGKQYKGVKEEEGDAEAGKDWRKVCRETRYSYT